jgi:hypothetical protein
MADLNYLQTCVQSVLNKYAESRNNQQGVEVQTIFDVERNHYQLFYIGWEGYKRVFYPIIHIDIKDSKVWIQHNATEELIADDLMNLQIKRDDIVLGLHHPSTRPYTDFAVV